MNKRQWSWDSKEISLIVKQAGADIANFFYNPFVVRNRIKKTKFQDDPKRKNFGL